MNPEPAPQAHWPAAPVSAREWRALAWLAAAVAVFTSVPYLLAWHTNAPGFTGFLIGVEDGNSYIAKMLQGAAGDWLFRSAYSTQPQHGALLYLPYLLLGKLLGPASHGSYVLAFHLWRVASLALLSAAAYRFVAHFVATPALRRGATLLALLGSGLGWLPLLLGYSHLWGGLPLDFYSPETFGYLATFGLPHLVLGRALLLWGLLAVLQGCGGGWRLALVWLALALVHLLSAALGLVLLLVYLAARLASRQPWRAALAASAWAGAGAAGPLLYNAAVYLHDAYLQGWAAQNQILTPHPWHYLLAYGWLLPLAYAGWRRAGLAQPLRTFSAAWLLSLPVLLYLPLGLQRRFAEAAWVLLLALALRALEAAPAFWPRRGLWLLILTAAPSTLLLWGGALQVAAQPAMPAFRPADEVALFQTLRGQPGATVLAAYAGGNALPAWAPVRVVIGHGPETVGLEALEAQVRAFYQGEGTALERQAFLRQHAIAFVMWGPAEQQLSGGAWAPLAAEYLQPDGRVGAYELLRVLP
ncbi:MAG: hypothetical protein KF821_02880 [Anaerolineales bacterium]|nr:hypothetical protein [Anaerolineales bacterium]